MWYIPLLSRCTNGTLGRDGTAGLWYSVGKCGMSHCHPKVLTVHLDEMGLQDRGIVLVHVVHPIAVQVYQPLVHLDRTGLHDCGIVLVCVVHPIADCGTVLVYVVHRIAILRY